ncbi:MAG: hypothetical protein Q9217_002391 [Psora testacea]
MTGSPTPHDGVKGSHYALDYAYGGPINTDATLASSIQYTSHAETHSASAYATIPSKISIAVDPVALITTECITVTSAMRKHARWAHSSVSAILGGAGASSDRGSSWSPTRNGKASGHQRGASQIGRLRRIALEDDDGLVGHWGRRGKKGKSMQDNPLMSAFARLRGDLRGCTDIRIFDTPSLLHPFLQVIRSSSTSASITSLAIVGITKFFDYKIIGPDSPRLPLAMQLLSAAITHCRFEASDSAADEIVLLQILRLMESMISGPGGNLLGDESVCEMMETGLSMCCQKRLSELVRRSAEVSMIKMCQVIFERLNALDFALDQGSETVPAGEEDSNSLVMMGPAVNGAPIGSMKAVNGSAPVDSETLQDPQVTANGNQPGLKRVSGGVDGLAPAVSDKIEAVNGQSSSIGNHLDKNRLNSEACVGVLSIPASTSNDNAKIGNTSDMSAESSITIKPYSLPSIRELFRVLVDLLRPQNKEHDDALRVMALRIIDVALEIAGPSIARHPSLATLAKDDLCRYLFQLIRTDSTQLLNESLRVAGTLLATCREVLKLQQELFLSYLVECLHPRVEIPEELGINPELYEGVPKTPKLVRPAASQTTSGRSTPVPVKERHQLGMDGTSRKPDAREAMIESIGALSRIPSYLVELYVNYDCEVDRNDLCEDLVGLLSRNAFPDSATWSTTSVPPLALDSLLGYVQFVAERLDDEPIASGYPDTRRLGEQRARKKIIITGAMRFNADPMDGIAYLAANGIIDNPDNPHSVATFLKSTIRIAKKKLGEYISKRDQEPLLKAFLELFDFTGKRVDEALRDLLNSFRLPGEAQLIERIVKVFSQKYCANSTPEGIANEDAVFTLTYSIIMLNTDQHNPNVKKEKRMTSNDFAKNLRGINGGGDFAPEYLEEIYKNIRTNEIILPDEHNNNKAFHYTWEGLLAKARNAGTLTICNTNVFDADMFRATWRPIVATLSYVFMSASDDVVFSRVVLGFDQCAQIAARYGITEALDRIVFCLSSMSSLSSKIATNTALNTEVQADGKSIMVSELAVKFGRDYKAQLACAVLFRLIPGKEQSIQDGWQHISRIWLNLFTNSLLPPTFSKSQDLLHMPPISLQPPSHIIDRGGKNSEAGLLSSFTSYLSSYAADEPPEPSEEEVESTLCAVDCLASCPMETIFVKILPRQMPPEMRQRLLRALLKYLPEPSSPVVLVARPDQPRPIPVRTNGHRNGPQSQPYNPSVAFVLELAIVIATRDATSVALMGEAVADALQNVVRDANNVHPLVLSRAVFYLLHLLKASQMSQDRSIVKTPVVLHTISGFDQHIVEKAADHILQGLALCLQSGSSLRNEIVNIPDFWNILRSLHTVPEAAPEAFNIVENIVTSEPVSVTADNYGATITILNDFASAGSIGAAVEQQGARKQPGQQRDRRGQRFADNVPTQPSSADREIVVRGYKAVILISQLTYRVPDLIKYSKLKREEAWIAYWTPIFHNLRTQCLNPCRKIRRQACSSLQNALLSSELSPSDDEEWTLIFRDVLFDLIKRLIKPEVYQTDPIGMSETRLQAANLLCRTFLHHLPLLSQKEGMLDLWLHILDIMDRLMNSGQGDNLEEAVPESLKNILLVMAGSGILKPPAPEQPRSELWDETCKRVDRFLPNLIVELFPRAEEPPLGSHPPTASAETAGQRQKEDEDGEHADTPAAADSAVATKKDQELQGETGREGVN